MEELNAQATPFFCGFYQTIRMNTLPILFCEDVSREVSVYRPLVYFAKLNIGTHTLGMEHRMLDCTLSAIYISYAFHLNYRIHKLSRKRVCLACLLVITLQATNW